MKRKKMHEQTTPNKQVIETNTFNQFVLAGLIVLCSFFFFHSCRKSYTPKPIAYHRIDFPEKEYRIYQSDCPYSFEYPLYAVIVVDTTGYSEPCWINIVFPEYAGTVHISYKKVNDNLNTYIEDTHKYAFKHDIKADAIEQRTFHIDSTDVHGILYDIKGNVASSVNFFVTDSNNHFIRGSLYFYTTPDKDSLAPVIRFFREDIVHMIKTMKWK
jgi:gliding motility-associated lipoprotein GldD